MKRSKKALLAAGLIMGAVALTGCAGNAGNVGSAGKTGSTASAAKTPQAAVKQTAQPEAAQESAQPSASPQAEESEAPGALALQAAGQKIDVGGIEEEGVLMLPLAETSQALGWTVKQEAEEEETLTRRTMQLRQGESQITVSWVVSDNTARQITWQKDGLLIPVDAHLTTLGESVYVPAAFFETAMDVRVEKTGNRITVEKEQPKETAPKDVQTAKDAQ